MRRVLLAASAQQGRWVFRQVAAPVRWGGGPAQSIRVSSGLRREPLDDSPVVFDDSLVALLQLLVLRPRVHLTHVGHQLLRAEALLHLCQLPLIFLHRSGSMVWWLQKRGLTLTYYYLKKSWIA